MTPTIETKRLLLRGHKLEDFSACAEMWTQPLVTRYTIGSPSSESRTWSRMLSYLGHWNLMDFGYWAVEEKASKSFIGELGFANMKREIDTPLSKLPELGWALMPRFHGKGYATEALHAVSNWGDQNLGVEKTFCIINPENLASIRVAEKIGYQESQKGIYNGESVLIFARPTSA